MLQSKIKPVLPHEILLEILSRVPVKDLMRSRCVSKSWNSLVFDPTFIKLHLQRSSKNSHILITFVNHHVDYGDLIQMIRGAQPCSIHGLLENPSSIVDGCLNYGYHVMGVCNGLVCLFDEYFVDDISKFGLKFWNPTTRLMSGRFELSPDLQHFKSFGFGYDDWSDTYKVVQLFLDVKSQKTEVKVYCLGDTCWTNILTCTAFPIRRFENGRFVSGTINWLALRKFDSKRPWRNQWRNHCINEFIIFSYDLRSETYRYLSIPHDVVEVPTHGFTLNVLKGYLCFSYLDNGHFVVLQMKEFGVDSSWTRLLKISYDQLKWPQIISENEDVMLVADYDDSGGSKFITYNKRDNAIDCHKAFFDGKYTFESYDYVESLALPY